MTPRDPPRFRFSLPLARGPICRERSRSISVRLGVRRFLKSGVLLGACGFESRPRHHESAHIGGTRAAGRLSRPNVFASRREALQRICECVGCHPPAVEARVVVHLRVGRPVPVRRRQALVQCRSRSSLFASCRRDRPLALLVCIRFRGVGHSLWQADRHPIGNLRWIGPPKRLASRALQGPSRTKTGRGRAQQRSS